MNWPAPVARHVLAPIVHCSAVLTRDRQQWIESREYLTHRQRVLAAWLAAKLASGQASIPADHFVAHLERRLQQRRWDSRDSGIERRAG